MRVARPAAVGHHSPSSLLAAPTTRLQLPGTPRSGLCLPTSTPSPTANLGGRCNYNPINSSSRQRLRIRPAAQQQHDVLHGSHEEEEHEGGDADVPDLFAPLPPTQQASLGRKRKVALLIAAAMLEISLTGALVWSPFLCAVGLAVMQPTKAEIEQQQEEAVKQAVAAAEVQAYRHLPVTPVESAAWMNRLNQDMWQPFWQPFLLANNLSSWQDTVSAAAPKGWEVEIADVSIGTLAPQMKGFQAFADPDSGVVTAVDADMSFTSDSVRLVVVGRGPLGAFTATVSAVQMEGHMRITPLLQHRMLLVAFKSPPSVRVSLRLSAPLFKSALSPGDLGQLNFIQGLIGSAVKDQMVEPRRIAVSLDSEISVDQAVSTTLHLAVGTITGLPRSTIAHKSSAAAARGSASGGSSSSSSAAATSSKVALVLIDTTTQVRRASRAVSPTPLRRSALLGESLSLELRRKQGLFRLEVREVAWGPGGRVSASRGQLLGSCLLWVAAARDGTTLFWTHDRSGAPLATRWSPSSLKPWALTLPLSPEVPGAQALSVSLGVSVGPWVYKAGRPAGLTGLGGSDARTPGPRVVVLQVVEARGLGGPPGFTAAAAGRRGAQGPTTHIQVAYGQDTYRTSTQYGSTSPIFNEVFAFAENPGLLTTRIKLELWQDDAPAAAAAGGSSNGGGSASKPPSSSSGTYRRVLVPSRRAGLKAVTRLRHSSNGSSSSSRTSSSSGGRAAAGSNGGSSVTSFQLPDVEPESDSEDPDSHMLIDLQLQEEEEEQQQQGQVSIESSSSSSSSSSGGSAGSASLGGTSIELDQLTEGLVQDRWFELSGAEGVQVRLRLAVVPGALTPAAAASARSSSSSRRQQQQQQQLGRDDVPVLLSFFHKQLQCSSRESIMVEVVSARLYLPLSSMDSSDLDQPSYVLCYGGAATVTTPPYGRPARSRPASRTSSGGGGGGGGMNGSRPSGGASRGGTRSSSTEPISSSSKAAAGSSSSGSSATSSMFEDVLPGNVSQQVTEETCLARAVFPLHPDGSKLRSTAAESPDGVTRNSAAAAAPRLKVLLFDPEDLEHASPAAAAAAFAAAAAAASSSSSSSRAASPGDAAAPAGSGVSAAGTSGGQAGPASHPITLPNSSSSSSSLSDIGCVEVDVERLLTLARQGKGSSSSAPPTAGTAAGASSDTSSSSMDMSSSSTTVPVCWEGWVKLDKDGGQLLLRLTQLPAAEPADIVPPIVTPTAISSSSNSSKGAAGGQPGSTQRVAAAAAAVAGPAAAAAAAAGGSSGADGDGLEGGEGLQERAAVLLKQGLTQAQEQVSGAVQQLGDATAAAAQWISSSIPSWLTPWVRPAASSSSNGNSIGASKPSQQQQGQLQNKGSPAAQRSEQSEVDQQPAGDIAAAAAAAAGSGAASLQAAEKQMQQQKQLQQQEPAASFAVDLRFISRALGLGGSGPNSKKPQQQQQQQAGNARGKQQLQQLAVPSHPLPNHALQASVSSVDEAQQQQQQQQTTDSSSGRGGGGAAGSNGWFNSSSNAVSKQQQKQRGGAVPTGSDAAAAAMGGRRDEPSREQPQSQSQSAPDNISSGQQAAGSTTSAPGTPHQQQQGVAAAAAAATAGVRSHAVDELGGSVSGHSSGQPADAQQQQQQQQQQDRGPAQASQDEF